MYMYVQYIICVLYGTMIDSYTKCVIYSYICVLWYCMFAYLSRIHILVKLRLNQVR